MKKLIFLFGLATMFATALSFSSCSSEDLQSQNAPQKSGNEILFTYQSAAGTRTATDPQPSTTVATGLNVGIFGVSSETTTTMNNYSNNKYLTAAAGVINLAEGSSDMTWPTTGEATASLYAYAPYQENWTVNAANTFSVQADQSSDANYLASDLLYASATNQAQNSTVALVFSHKLSKVSITIKKATVSNVNLANAKVYITNTKPSTTLNPSTGALGAESGDFTDITAATIASDLTAGDDNSTATACAVVVPQTIAANTGFIKIVTADSRTFIGKLSAETTLVGGHSYSMTISVGTSTASVTEVPIALGSTSLVAWSDNAIGATLTYVAGDYVLNDGTLVHKNNLTDAQKSLVRAIVFTNSSNELSDDDKTAGYIGYAMSVKVMGSKSWKDTESHEEAPGSFAASLEKLNGSSKTATLQTAWSGKMDNAIVNFTNFTSSSNPLVAGAIVGAASGNRNLSGWFAPAFGQMVQILNNLGNAGITSELVIDWGAGSGDFYTSTSSSVLSTINGKVKGLGNSAIFSTGQVFTSVTENGANFFYVKVTDGDLNYGLGKTAGKDGTNRNVLPILAFKLPVTK